MGVARGEELGLEANRAGRCQGWDTVKKGRPPCTTDESLCSSGSARNRGRAAWLPQGARVGWLDGQDLFLDIDSAYRATQAMAADGDGIAVGILTLVKRLHEGGWLKSVDERRGKLKVRRMIDGRRLEVLHLHANGARV